MKVLHGAWFCSFKQMNEGNTVQRVLFHGVGIANQVDNQSNTGFQFNLNTFNVCCIQVHKTKYSMNMQYPILANPEIVWAPYHIF